MTFHNNPVTMIYSFQSHIPVVDPSAFIHPLAAVTGKVTIGKDVYVGPGAAIRGDWGGIIIEDGCNVQENCTIHMFPGIIVRIEENDHIGHGAVIQGAFIGKNCLIGMNAVIMDEVVLGEECIVGALTFIKTGEKIPRRSLIAGNPGKVIREVSDEIILSKTDGTALYQKLPVSCMETLRVVVPLYELPDGYFEKDNDPIYKPWKPGSLK